MPDYAELHLSDDSVVRLALAPASTPETIPAARPGDLPDGSGNVEPIGRGRDRVSVLATDGLRSVLRPLGPLLQEVHDAVAGTARPPQELSVEFGVQIGQDLKLGVVGSNSHATMKVTATWTPHTDASQAG